MRSRVAGDPLKSSGDRELSAAARQLQGPHESRRRRETRAPQSRQAEGAKPPGVELDL